MTGRRCVSYVTGFGECSGNMDPRGAYECVRMLLESDEAREFGKVVLGEDGDVKTCQWARIAAARAWSVGKCKCHKGKNLRKVLKAHMSGKQCQCPGGTKCQNIAGRRWRDDMSGKVSARFYYIIREAERLYLPERHDPRLPKKQVGTKEREHARLRAIEWAKSEVIAMAHHFCGDHSLCTRTAGHGHGPLPEDHPAVQCEAQREYLVDVLEALVISLPDILTPMGAIHINSTESCHAILRMYRDKGTKWAAVPCFLGENFGFLHWQRLELSFWGVETNPWVDFASLINKQTGIEVPIFPEKLAEWEEQLRRGVRGKVARKDPKFKAKRGAYRAKKAGYAAAASAGSAYQSGGSEAALQADLSPPTQREEEGRFLGLAALDDGERMVVERGETGGLHEQRGSEMQDEDGDDAGSGSDAE